MKYTVVWKPSAVQELASHWNDAPDRQQIREAADTFDREAARRPLYIGESRAGGMRVAFVGVLGFFFHVNEGDRVVSVLRVWRVA